MQSLIRKFDYNAPKSFYRNFPIQTTFSPIHVVKKILSEEENILH